MPICKMCQEQKRSARNRAGRRARLPRNICDDCMPKTLAAVRARGADDAARALLTGLYEQHSGSVAQIAQAVGTERVHVRQYLKRYGIGRYAKGAKA